MRKIIIASLVLLGCVGVLVYAQHPKPGNGGSASGITTLNTLSADPQTFADADDTNVTLTISSASSTHTFTLGWTGALAKARQHAATVYNDAGNIWSTGAQDFGGATSLKIPVSAGATTATNGFIAYDSTNHMLHGAQSGADAKIPQFTITPTNDNCVKWLVSGSNYKLDEVACGSGGLAADDTAAIDFGSMGDGQCLTDTFTLTGALTTDYVAPLRPSGLNSKIAMEAWVSASDTITVRLCNFTGETQDPGSLTYGAGVLR